MKQDSVIKIIERSGIDLQYTAATHFQSCGWIPQMSPYYVDLISRKSREIDIVGREDHEIKERSWRDSRRMVVRVFTECKYILEPVVFWFQNKEMGSARKYAKDNLILRAKDDRDITFHHYLEATEVARNWSSQGGQQDVVYKAWEQVINALIFFQKNSYESTPYVLDYPVIVVDSYRNLSRRTADGYAPLSHPFQIEIDYVYYNEHRENYEKRYFLIDVIAVDELSVFLNEKIGGDVTAIRNILFEQIDAEKREELFERHIDHVRYDA